MAANEPIERVNGGWLTTLRQALLHRMRKILARPMRTQLAPLHRPRLHMAIIVALTGVLGFVASFLLLEAGMTEPWLRYPLAVALAYGVFMLLLWAWVQSRGADSTDAVPDESAIQFDDSQVQDAGALELEDFVLITLALVLLAGAASFAASIVWAVPDLLAELLVAAVLSLALYRGMHSAEREHRLPAALRRMAWRVAAIAVGLSLIGAAMQFYAPGATTVGEVVEYRRVR